VRGVFEALGFKVDWHHETQTAILETEGFWVTIPIGSDIFITNGIEFELDVPAQIINDRTMLPIRAVLESVGHFVDWDDTTNTVIVRNLWGSYSFEYIDGSLANQLAQPAIGEQIAIIHTNFGEIHLRLFPELAPLAVENFVTLAQNGFYDGLVFHRVVDDFMIQGGDPDGMGFGGNTIWDMLFGVEASPNLRHIRGALSTANTGWPMANGSQFFIVQASNIDEDLIEEIEFMLENQDMEIVQGAGYRFRDLWPTEVMEHYLENGGMPHLDFLHTVFGQVFMGMDVVDTIAAMPTDGDPPFGTSRPLEDVVIKRIEILIFGY